MYSVFRSPITFVLLLLPLTIAKLPWERTASDGYGTLTTSSMNDGTVLRAVFNNPPINLYNYKLINDLYDLLLTLVPLNDTTLPPAPKVVIFASANPDFWIAHYDLHIISTAEPEFNATYSSELGTTYVETVGLLHSLPTIFIGEINGRAFGAGSEIAVQLDMRFSGPNTLLGSLEVALGVIHGNGGSQYLTRLIGPGYAAEYLYSSGTIDATEAARIGWVNRAYGSGEELTDAVNQLASRIATFSAAALNGTKVSIQSAGPSREALEADLDTFTRLASQPIAQELVEKFFELSYNQSLGTFELGLDGDLVELYPVSGN
ncbi:MAG: hypothetical protein MMC33_010204 [Icmadophila ericetorum]|nr:hypothetical protein [Icmadophila ericetorum]